MPDMAELLQRLDSGRAVRMAQGTLNRLEQAGRSGWKALAEKRVLTDPLAFVQDRRMQLDYVQQRLADGRTEPVAGGAAALCATLAAALDALSPLKVLGRGYAMAQAADGSSAADGARQVQSGDRIQVRLGEGGLRLHAWTEKEEA